MLLSLLCLTSLALAEPDPSAVELQDRSVYRAVTEISEDEFLQLQLKGQLVRPSGLLTLVRPTPKFHPLIQLRADFNQEIQESTALMNRVHKP